MVQRTTRGRGRAKMKAMTMTVIKIPANNKRSRESKKRAMTMSVMDRGGRLLRLSWWWCVPKSNPGLNRPRTPREPSLLTIRFQTNCCECLNPGMPSDGPRYSSTSEIAYLCRAGEASLAAPAVRFIGQFDPRTGWAYLHVSQKA